MLVSLTLDNLALIKHHQIDFDGRFNVITGETGAGKSLILDALSLCIGGRADLGLVRHGADEAVIFGEFDVSNNQAVQAWFEVHEREFEETLLIRRKIGHQGRSKSWINGVPASMSELKSLGEILVSIHSQHAGLELLKPQFVMDWLDGIGQLYTLKNATKDAYQAWQEAQNLAKKAKQEETGRADRMALLNAKLTDIQPLLGINFTQIESEYDELSNLESLMQDALTAKIALETDDDAPSVLSLLSRAIKICDSQSDKSKVFSQCSQLLNLAQEQISESVSMLADYAEQSLPDEERLNELNHLLGLAHRLANKYHTPIDELIKQADEWQSELDVLMAIPDNQTLEKEVAKAFDVYVATAEKLAKARQDVAPKITQTLTEYLVMLALPNATCEFAFYPKSVDGYTAHGMQEVALLFSANVGMPKQPLHKVASGGELSRIALVMQVMNADKQTQMRPTLVFDEVDVGISGATAQVVGELLRKLGKHQQLLAITHQAQVAAAAHQHILVTKEHGEQTVSHLKVITDNEQIDELARMSGGVNITDATKAHVKSLLADIVKMDKTPI